MALNNRLIFGVSMVASLVYVFTVPGSWLVGTRIALLGIGIVAIVAYMSDTRERPFATFMAILIGGASAAMITQGLTNFVALSQAAEPWLVVYLFAQTCILVRNGGNMAKLFHNEEVRG
jgi:hypothetical protein